jgi:hypothetical protein
VKLGWMGRKNGCRECLNLENGLTLFIENCVKIFGRESRYLKYSRGLDSIGLVLIPTRAMADLNLAPFHPPADMHSSSEGPAHFRFRKS